MVEEAGLLSFADVEARLVEAVALWRRSPGGGRWPFAGDAPWHLMTRETNLGDYDARGGDMEQAAVRALPLSIAEVGERDEVSGWLAMVGERDRRLVVLVVAQLAKGRTQVDWMAMRRSMGVVLGADGLRMRYSRAIGRLTQALNAGRGGPSLRFTGGKGA